MLSVRVPKTERIRHPQQCKSIKGFIASSSQGSCHIRHSGVEQEPRAQMYSSIQKFRTKTGCWQGLIGCRGFLVLSCISFLYILEINPLSVVSFVIIFSHSEGLSFHLPYSFLCFCMGLIEVPAWDLLKEVTIIFIISTIVWPQVKQQGGNIALPLNGKLD